MLISEKPKNYVEKHLIIQILYSSLEFPIINSSEMRDEEKMLYV